MLPIVQLPEIISHYSPHFEEVFSEGEYAHLKKYLSGLLVSENKTVEAINRLFVLDVQDQSSLNRFLTHSKYSIADLHSKRLGLLNSQAETKLKSLGVWVWTAKSFNFSSKRRFV